MKKLIALLLTFVLILSAVPFTASATESESTNILYFDANTAPWTDYSQIYCHIWEYGGESFYAWQSRAEKCTDENQDGIWEYDLDFRNISLKNDVPYCILFLNDNGEETSFMLFDTTVVGDTVCCTEEVEEYPYDCTKVCQVAYWKNQNPAIYGPLKTITSMGNVVGTCLPSDMNNELLFIEYLKSNNFTYTRNNTDKSDQAIIDDIGLELDLSKDQVSSVIEAASIPIVWSWEKSILKDDVDPVISIDIPSTGWSDFSQVFCHIYSVDKGYCYAWQTKAEKCIDNGDGTWSYNLDDHGITLATNETYFCIFSNDKGKMTYQLALSSSAFGHTAYCVDICENPTDYRYNVQIANWNDIDPKVLGPELAITQRAEIVGTFIPHETSKVEILAKWIEEGSLIWASMDLGLTEQEVLDSLKVKLDLNNEDVIKAIELSKVQVDWAPANSNLVLGERKTITIPAGSSVSLYFTAEELAYDEVYSFRSFAENCNPYCVVYYDDGVLCDSSDDSDKSYNFNLTGNLSQDNTFKFVISCHDNKEVTFDVLLTIVDEDEVPVYEYKILNDNNIELDRYNSYVNYSDSNLEIPEAIDGFTVTTIGEYAFKEGLMEEVIIPDTVINIEDYAFVHAYNLKTVVIPESVENLGQGAFHGCDYLEKVTILSRNCRIIDNTEPPANTIFDETTIPENATIYGYTGSTAEEYANKYGRKFVALDGTTDDPTKPTQPALGDVDGDGDISVMDATGIQLHIASLETLEGNAIIVADADGDGNVSIMDATQIQLFIAKLIPEL